MDQRLENYLVKQSQTLGNTLKMTHHDIAKDLNTSREVISRLLKKMEAKGWGIIQRNSIHWIRKEKHRGRTEITSDDRMVLISIAAILKAVNFRHDH